jgi:small subunit ribosomal protein S9
MSAATATAEKPYGTGRRKEAVARVFLVMPGSGRITVNGRTLEEYFPREALRIMLQMPFVVTNTVGHFDVSCTLKGGGIAGQAGALRHGLSRALEEFNPEFRPALKHAGFLTRDSREKERKKYGQRGARARFQFSKR